MTFYTFTALAALAGSILSMAIALVWYGPLMFGKKWGEITGRPMPEQMPKEEKKAAMKAMMPHMILNLVVGFVQYYALGFFAAFIGGLTVSGALFYGLFVWLGFVMPVQAGMAIWSGKSKKLSWAMFGITAGYQLLSILVGAVAWSLLYSWLAF